MQSPDQRRIYVGVFRPRTRCRDSILLASLPRVELKLGTQRTFFYSTDEQQHTPTQPSAVDQLGILAHVLLDSELSSRHINLVGLLCSRESYPNPVAILGYCHVSCLTVVGRIIETRWRILVRRRLVFWISHSRSAHRGKAIAEILEPSRPFLFDHD